MAELVSTSHRVVDRQSLKAVVDELDIAALFDNPAKATRLTMADIVVVGRYAVERGYLHLALKGVAVRSAELVCLGRYNVPVDASIRPYVPVPHNLAPRGEGMKVWEAQGGVRIRASHREPGADELRLLDRARQHIRRALQWYLVDVAGIRADAETVDKRFRAGREIDCCFRSESVTLEMEFKVRQ